MTETASSGQPWVINKRLSTMRAFAENLVDFVLAIIAKVFQEEWLFLVLFAANHENNCSILVSSSDCQHYTLGCVLMIQQCQVFSKCHSLSKSDLPIKLLRPCQFFAFAIGSVFQDCISIRQPTSRLSISAESIIKSLVFF